MPQTEYIWKNGLFIEKSKAKTSVMTHALHYGTAVFEGIRAYDTENGTAILKLDDHVDRFIYSMNTLGMKVLYSKEKLIAAIIDTVKKNPFKACYIRPLAYFGEGDIAVLPKKNHPIDIIIACLPMGRYLNADSINVVVSKYIRIHPQSTKCDAKISGHYINSVLAGLPCQDGKYHEALLLDVNGFVAEGAAQNIFIVKNKNIITPPLGTILNGITRKLVIEIAKKNGIKVHEKYFKVDDVINAEEAFFSGTAAEITPIASLNDQKIGKTGIIGPITRKIKKIFFDITNGKVKNNNFLTYIK